MVLQLRFAGQKWHLFCFFGTVPSFFVLFGAEVSAGSSVFRTVEMFWLTGSCRVGIGARCMIYARTLSLAGFQIESLTVVFEGELFHRKCGSKDSPGCIRCQVNHLEEHSTNHRFVFLFQVNACTIWSLYCRAISGLKRKGILLKTQR